MAEELVNGTIRLAIQSRLEHVRLIRAALFGVLDHLRVVESDIQALELAVTEIVNNSVEHGYAGSENEQVKVLIEVCGSQVQIEVVDTAEAFPEDHLHRLLGEPEPMPEPDEEWSLRGHGLQIVRQIVDTIAVKSNEDGNVLTFSKHVAFREG
jgi:anti-sigma regulatory factor (Ser/Thr protein kinase)